MILVDGYSRSASIRRNVGRRCRNHTFVCVRAIEVGKMDEHRQKSMHTASKPLTVCWF